MPQSLANILVHTVFSTHDRRPFLQEQPVRDELYRYLGGILIKLSCSPLIIGGTADHVHLLHRLARTGGPAAVVKELKRGSSLWIKTQSPALNEFAWQSGYGIFFVGISEVDATHEYIATQEQHHRTVTFQDELRGLLKRHGIEFDERYIWE